MPTISFYNARNANAANTKQVLNQNQFGGVIGGPIKKDKLFIFGSYQGTRSRNEVAPQGNTSGVNVPLFRSVIAVRRASRLRSEPLCARPITQARRRACIILS